jgi:3-oxoadipate enol-lactonase
MTDFAAVAGLTVHYQLENTHLPGIPVVFVNSLGSDFRIWDGVVARLERPVLRYDKRGHGLSDAPSGAYAISDFANDLLGLLDQLKLERVVLVGISVGGQIALEFASRFPSRLAGVVFCDTGMKIGTSELWNARIAAVQDGGLESISTAVMQRWFDSRFHAGQAARVRGFQNMLERTSARGYVATCAALRDSDLHGAAKIVRESRVKTLVVCGQDDQSTPVALSQALAQTLETRLELIEDAGHLPCIQQPEPMANAIKSFLEVIA